MRELNLDRKFGAIIAWDSFFHLSGNDQRSMFSVFTAYMVAGGRLLFTSGFEQEEVYDQTEGHQVYHASLNSEEYHSLLEPNGFEVISHRINDVTCGNHPVWLVRLKAQ
ncbi:hypothetical protein [Spirosoma luteum]|uniref:hypothetical protein n=1 Tax=Spirosoma luteum TaxID=431553 RepID=UPI000375A3EB|nr:hypothetical protein [Spirosoma luteum]